MLHETKMLLHSEGEVRCLISRVNRQAMGWEKILASCTSDREVTYRIYKELTKSNTPKMKTELPTNKWANVLITQTVLIKLDRQVTNKSISLKRI